MAEMQVTQQEIKTIVQRYLQGDRSAEREIFNKLYPHVYRLACQFVGSDDAEDICVESFVKLYKNLHKYDVHKPILPWLRKIVINTVVDKCRKEKSLKGTLLLDELEREVLPSLIMPDETKQVQISYKNLQECIEELPPAYRNVFTLYALKGLKHNEIARILNISEGTSKSNYAKARKKLQAIICSRHKSLSYCRTSLLK